MRRISLLSMVLFSLLCIGCTTPQALSSLSDNQIYAELGQDATILNLTTKTSNSVAGQFKSQGVELTFLTETGASSSSVVISDAAGTPIISAMVDENGPVHTFHTERGPVTIKGGVAENCGKLSPIEREAIEAYLASSYFKALPRLSKSLALSGVGGHNFPATLALHRASTAAAAIEDATYESPSDQSPGAVSFLYANPRFTSKLGISDDFFADNIDPCFIEPGPFGPSAEHAEAISQACRTDDATYACDGEPIDTSNGCSGMCGIGCDQCWVWVCGDCCEYGGCKIHDDLTRNCIEGGISGAELLTCHAAAYFFPVTLLGPLSCLF